MRFRAASLLAGALLLTTIESPLSGSAQASPDPSFARLRLVRDTGEEHGTAVLIDRHDQGSETILTFLTSSWLFRAARGDDRSLGGTIELLLENGHHPLQVRRGDVFMASGSCVDIAVFRITTTAPTALVPQRIMYEAPHAGAAFVISGYDQAGRPTRVAAQIRFRSTLMAIGDRDVSSLDGCIGAPAVSPEGVFGLVSECQPNRSPVITLLSVARHFIERYR